MDFIIPYAIYYGEKGKNTDISYHTGIQCKSYLRRCINSVIQQTYKNLDIILVDDGSTDGCSDICDSYATQDKRIRVIHKENGGLSSARNSGMKVAKGKYWTFIDSDDYVSPQYVEYLYFLANSNGAEYVSITEHKFYDGEEPEKYSYRSNVIEFSAENALKNLFYRKNIQIYAHGKLYKKELWDGIEFPVGKLFEDVAVQYLILEKAEKVVWSSEVHYYYYQRNNSIMNSVFDPKKMYLIDLCEEILEYELKYHPQLYQAAASKLFVSALDLYRRVPADDSNKNYCERLENIIKKYRKQIILDKEEKCSLRVISLVTYIGVKRLRFLGAAHAFVKKQLR